MSIGKGIAIAAIWIASATVSTLTNDAGTMGIAVFGTLIVALLC